jgi:hypothetical protein
MPWTLYTIYAGDALVKTLLMAVLMAGKCNSNKF